MNIAYCDKCGEIIQGASHTLGAEVLCVACKGSAGPDTAPRRQGRSGMDEDFSLSSMLEADEMEMFSSDTIARRKSSPAPKPCTMSWNTKPLFRSSNAYSNARMSKQKCASAPI